MLSHPPESHTGIEAVCAASYLADRIPAYAFVFRVPTTDTRFTVYARDPHRYRVNGTYTLTIPDPDHPPLWLSTNETAFLRHCLGLVEQRWREAIAEADAAAERPPTARTPTPGHLNIEPTPTGYRAIADRFRDELGRVHQIRSRLNQLLPAADVEAAPHENPNNKPTSADTPPASLDEPS